MLSCNEDLIFKNIKEKGMHENQEIKNCPKCLDKKGTLVELEYADSKKKFYYCAECKRSFDYNDKTPCGTYGTMIDLKGTKENVAVINSICLNCGKKLKDH